jgi:hypothetical protein
MGFVEPMNGTGSATAFSFTRTLGRLGRYGVGVFPRSMIVSNATLLHRTLQGNAKTALPPSNPTKRDKEKEMKKEWH